MATANNVMYVRHKLLKNLVELWKNNQLVEEIDRIPINYSPRRATPKGRCCIHKERAVLKYKSLPLLGWDMSDETDELTPLSEYARRALERSKVAKENILCVIDEACSSCVQINYEISNLCKGCVARSCHMNCPKDSVFFDKQTGQAHIDHSTCISCGICHKSCPYHAIVYIPVPCEEACPVKAISKDEYGVEHIDENRCIYCGKCVNACPFGAIFEISQVFDVLEAIRKGEKVIAIPAPSVLGQFKAPIEQVYGAILEIGFHDIIEVAHGAMHTIKNEGEELLEKLGEGQSFMTTSCCPSYIELVEKHVPQIKPFVSHTGSPMYYAARVAKEKYPDAKVCFIGPCIAKRKEAQRDECVDLVMTFEELHPILEGMGIDIATAKPYKPAYESVREAHGFANAGGVAASVKAYLGHRGEGVSMLNIADFNKKNIGLIKGYARAGKADAQFVEMMSCPGGCITGPVSYNDAAKGTRQLNADLQKRTLDYTNYDPASL